MKKDRRAWFFIVIALLILPLSGAVIELSSEYPAYGEQVYIKNCGSELNLSVSCINDTLVEKRAYGDGCYLYYFDTKELYCQNPSIKYTQDGREVTEEVKIKNYESVLHNYIEDDSMNPVTLAKEAYIFSLVGEEGKIEPHLEKLKTLRDEDKKCWPAGTCSIKDTVDVIYYLSLAGVNRSKRVYHDALFWIEDQQNQPNYDSWVVTVYGEENSACSADWGSSTTTFTLNENETHTFGLDYDSDEYLEVLCDDDFRALVLDEFDNKIYDDSLDGNESVKLLLPGGCWPYSPINDSKEHCPISITAKAVTISGIDSDAKTNGDAWLKGQIVKAQYVGKKINSSEDILTNIIVYNITRDSEFRDWLLFSQNNDGSFGDKNVSHITLKAIEVFAGDSDNEWIQDAIEWVNSNRPNAGWGYMEQDARTYHLFGRNLSYIRIEPDFLVSESSVIEFEVSGDDALNYTLNLSDELQGKATLTRDKSKVKVALSTNKDGIYKGNVIAQYQGNRQSFPIILKKDAEFKLEFRDKYLFFSPNGSIDVKVTKSASVMDCTIEFDKVFENVSVKVANQSTLSFNYFTSEDVSETVSGTFACNSSYSQANGTFSFVVELYTMPPFKMQVISQPGSDPGLLEVVSNVDSEIAVTLGFEEQDLYYTVANEVVVGTNEKAVVYIYQDTAAEEEATTDNYIVGKYNGYETKVPVTLAHSTQTGEVPAEPYIIEKSLGIVGAILICIVLVAAGSGAYYFYDNYKKKKQKFEVDWQEAKKEDKVYDQEHSKHKKKKKKGKEDDDNAQGQESENKKPEKEKKSKEHPHPDQLIEVLMAVSKSAGEKDDEIISGLRKKGYLKNELKHSLKDVEDLEDEIEEEKVKPKSESEGAEQGKEGQEADTGESEKSDGSKSKDESSKESEGKEEPNDKKEGAK